MGYIHANASDTIIFYPGFKPFAFYIAIPFESIFFTINHPGFNARRDLLTHNKTSECKKFIAKADTITTVLNERQTFAPASCQAWWKYIFMS